MKINLLEVLRVQMSGKSLTESKFQLSDSELQKSIRHGDGWQVEDIFEGLQSEKKRVTVDD